ncbi:hypothetical protein FC756_14615 [Lysinibacillus mangiferihumi]|uniref:Uncharacterized protein n=1 Tax=Lysinibacillus mangiferihumi TaxID=1130819 RepID=A0A4U2YZI4_9BACI|nr:hypothetical protein [Lysinibacillus mangiferihumi]TKI66655.1 hypothetical protein FC756_14615 [Lysinibacillus mangiferihumi]
MNKSLKLKLELIRKEVISEIIAQKTNQQLDTNTAFKFIKEINNATYKEPQSLAIEAVIHDKKVSDLFINGTPLPF